MCNRGKLRIIFINFTDEWVVLDDPTPEAQEKKSEPSAQEDNQSVASDEVINTSGMFASIAAVPSTVVSFAANTLFSAIGLFAANGVVESNEAVAANDLIAENNVFAANDTTANDLIGENDLVAANDVEKKKLSESDSG